MRLLYLKLKTLSKSEQYEVAGTLVLVIFFILDMRAVLAEILPPSLNVFHLDYVFRTIVLIWIVSIPVLRHAIFKNSGVHSSMGTAWFSVIWMTGISITFGQSVYLILWEVTYNPSNFVWPTGAMSPSLRLFDLTVGLILVAITEELVFRKYLRRTLEFLRCSQTSVIWVSSILFGLIHWEAGSASVINAAFFGMLAMLAYYRTNQLWPCILAHYIVNFVVFAKIL